MFKKREKNQQISLSNEPIEAEMGSLKIATRHIYKDYISKKKQVRALEDVSIEILENDFVTIVGPSGCGKSTLLRILAGLDFPTQGEILVNGKVVTSPGEDRGMVFQSYTLFPWMTVEDNIKFGLKLRRLPEAEINGIVEQYLERIQLTKFKKSYPKELLGGMKQRVAIARALANRPEVLLMDEPFGALDPHTKEQMQLLLREIWEIEKPTIIFITHDIDEAVFLSNRLYIMSARPGKIKQIENIFLPYRRQVEMKYEADFIKLRNKINNALYHQEAE